MSAYRIPCKISELRLDKTLVCGQSFRWKESSLGVWVGVLYDRLWKIWQTESDLHFEVTPEFPFSTTEPIIKEEKIDVKRNKTKHVCISKDANSYKKRSSLQSRCSQLTSKEEIQQSRIKNGKVDIEDIDEIHVKQESDSLTDSLGKEFMHIPGEGTFQKPESLLRDYFQLDVNLADLYAHWASVDSNFKQISSNFEGVRILRQDPVENLFSFICSSNNNISRISGMVEKLCENYGKFVAEVDDKQYFAFPPISALAEQGVESELRNLGFGYRAKYINTSARMILEEHSVEWLYGLREKSYDETKAELMKLCGVGAKVADCVCLMSMDKADVVPVDTHVWQIAARHYMPKLQKTKSLTDKLYKEIGDHFRDLWGPYAGWAHSVLFTADLKKFKESSPSPKKSLKMETSDSQDLEVSPKKKRKLKK